MLDALQSRYSVALYAGVLASYLAFFVLEWLRPARRPSLRGFAQNLKYSAIFFAIGPLAAVIPAVLANKAVAHFGPFLRLDLSAYWPLALAPLFVSDFFYYWFHRLQHTRLLWWEHKLHHSDEHLCVATAYRHHFLEDALKAVLLVLPMSMVFDIKAADAGIVGLLAGQWGYFIHSNLRLRLGPIGYVLAGPQAHRIHHSIEPEHRDRNFAAFFSVIDVVFGTFHAPKPNEFPATGVADFLPAPATPERLSTGSESTGPA